MKFRWKHYTALYHSFGILLSRDCVLQQWEPYEVVKHWEPHLTIYFRKHQIRVWCEIPVYSWLGRRWGRTRDGEEST